MNFVIMLLYLLMIVAPFGTLIHEMGHMIGGLLVKADKVIFTIGSGRSLKTIHLRNVQCHLRLWVFAGGYATSERSTPYKKWERVAISLSGPIINLLTAVIIDVVNFSNHTYLHIFSLFNLWIAFINIIPFKIKDKQSDGFIILKSIITKA